MSSTTESPYAEKRRIYKRDWMRNFRAKHAKEAKEAEQAEQKQGPDPAVLERIAALEKELRDLKNSVGLDIDYIGDVRERVNRFRATLGAPHNGSIAARTRRIDDLEKEFNTIKYGLDANSTLDLYRGLQRERDKAHELEKRAQWLEGEILQWSKGGAKRIGKEKQIAEDYRKGKRMLNDSDPQKVRQGNGLIHGCLKMEGEIEVHLGRLKVELNALRA